MLAASFHLEQIRPRYESGAPRLLEQVREVIRSKHYSLRTEDAYIDWVRRFVRFCELRHPRDCGSAELEAFLTHLAVHGRVSASTQNQAGSAILFLYKQVLHAELPWLDNVVSAKRPARLPAVLTKDEVGRVLGETPRYVGAGFAAALRDRHASGGGAEIARERSRFLARRDCHT